MPRALVKQSLEAVAISLESVLELVKRITESGSLDARTPEEGARATRDAARQATFHILACVGQVQASLWWCQPRLHIAARAACVQPGIKALSSGIRARSRHGMPLSGHVA